MTPDTSVMPTDLLCDHCGYDLRGQGDDAACPECGTPVAASLRLAGVPRRPAWHASDPRWRRRMLAGAWVLVLVPLADVLRASGWADVIPTWTPFDVRGTVRVLSDTLLFADAGYAPVYLLLTFCTGVALLFAKERGRRRNRLDWTRRWGVICSYVAFLLAAAPVLFISALVAVGISALFLSMPPRYQPSVTQPLVNVSTAYLRYGPQPKDAAGFVHVASASIAMLLACVPLFDALRSSGPKRLAAALVAPLALFALVQLAAVGQYYAFYPNVSPNDVMRYGNYFCPELFARSTTSMSGWINPPPSATAIAVEIAKWCVVLAIAVWLSAATLIGRGRSAWVPLPGSLADDPNSTASFSGTQRPSPEPSPGTPGEG